MSASGVFIKQTAEGKTTVVTGQGVLRHFTVHLSDDSATGIDVRSDLFDNLKLYIDGEGAASTDIDFYALFGLPDDSGAYDVAAGAWDDNTPGSLVDDNGTNGAISPPNRMANFRYVNGHFIFVGMASVRIPFDVSLEAEWVGGVASDDMYMSFEIALF